MSVINAAAPAALTKFTKIGLVIDNPNDDPSSYVIRNAADGTTEVRLPHLTAGVERVTSDENPYGHIEVGVSYYPDPANPQKMIPRPMNPEKFRRIEEDARRRRRQVAGQEKPTDAVITELVDNLAAMAPAMQAIPDPPEFESEIPEPPHAATTPAPVIPRPKKPAIKIRLTGPHGIFRGTVLEVVRDQSQIICVTDEDSGFMIPPLDGAELKLEVAGRSDKVRSTGINFGYAGKLFVVFLIDED